MGAVTNFAPEQPSNTGGVAPTNILRTFAELREALSQLGPPPKGYTRVYRGQPTWHDKILPSAYRSPEQRFIRAVWQGYTASLAEVLLGPKRASERSSEFIIWALWARAIAQHYGPGSEFLDVTHSLDVALWFALHEGVQANIHSVFGPPGPLNPKDDELVSWTWLRYRPKDDGCLLVFDVSVWKLGSALGQGHLIDLAKAPSIFASSPRIRAQSACLLFADSTTAEGDLAKGVIGHRFAVGRPMTGTIGLDAPTEKFFPGPAIDPWYARFLSIPLTNHADLRTGLLNLTRPLPVTLYLPESRQELADVTWRMIVARPRLTYGSVHPDVPPLSRINPNSDEQSNVRLSDATVIVLDIPVIHRTPPAAGHHWNHGLLCTDLSDVAEATALGDV